MPCVQRRVHGDQDRSRNARSALVGRYVIVQSVAPQGHRLAGVSGAMCRLTLPAACETNAEGLKSSLRRLCQVLDQATDRNSAPAPVF